MPALKGASLFDLLGAVHKGVSMIHWGFLIPAFVAGFVSGYAFTYQMAKITGEVTATIEEATEWAGL